MKLRELVVRSMLKNMKHYYLYFFSLIFSVTLYFSFKTLRYNGDLTKQVSEGSTAGAGLEVATYLLYFIILVFVLYANKIFMQRRSKEIGLYQLIGMTKGLIFRLLAVENIILFSGAVLIGIVVGFLTSRIFAMILLKLVGQKAVLGLTFNWDAALMTVMIFAVMLVIILAQLYIIIRRQTLLEMFHAANKSDETVRKFSFFHMLMGVIGIGLIVYGYYMSTVLFEGAGDTLLRKMLLVLFSTIFGTYLIFRYSVALLINMWRVRRDGFLSRTDIVGLMPIMHRMKSSASSLTLIAVLTAVSLGVNTLSFISYYTAEKDAKSEIPAHFISLDERAKDFQQALDQENIEYNMNRYNYLLVEVDFKQLLKDKKDGENLAYEVSKTSRVVKASDAGEDLKDDEALVRNFSGYTAELMSFREGKIKLNGTNGTLDVKKLDEESLLLGSYGLTMDPVVIVSDTKYKQIAEGKYHYDSLTEYHINLNNSSDFERANELYIEKEANVREILPTGKVRYIESQKAYIDSRISGLGLTIFVTAFLGLAFLMASGSILYFKQMSEADMESSSYTILRKIGYSEQDIMHAIYRKQLFNFGVPVCIALLHSYFAVKSGWWFFGTEYKTPMLIMVIVYLLLYMLFAILAVRYYRSVVKKSF